jgi:hypothetical protein
VILILALVSLLDQEIWVYVLFTNRFTVSPKQADELEEKIETDSSFNTLTDTGADVLIQPFELTTKTENNPEDVGE